MRVLLAILLSLVCLSAKAAITYSNVVQVFLDFRSGTPGNWLTLEIATNSTVGYINWTKSTLTNFANQMIVTNYSLPLLTPQAIGGTNFTETGTKFIRYDHSTTNATEDLIFQTPGGGVYNFSNMVIKFVARFGATNSGANNNLDHWEVTGGSFCICQQQVSSTTNYLIAHGQTNGASLNGPQIPIEAAKPYAVEMIRDFVRSNCIVRVFDVMTGKLVGESTTQVFNEAGEFGTYRAALRANYLDLGGLTGFTEIGGISITYSNTTPALSLALPVESFLRSNKWEWIPGTNVGVRFGGIQDRSGTTRIATDAPYSADNTGASDAGADINSAITASSSNDVVYLPAGLYWADTSISMKSGVTLRGAGRGQTIIVGAIIVPSTGTGEYFDIASGATRGSTNLTMTDYTDAFARTIEANDILEISQIENDTDNIFPVWSASNARRTLGQMVHVASRSTANLTLFTPLMWNFTNSGKLLGHSLALNYVRGVGLEYFTITSTNSGISESPTWLISLAGSMDSWIRGVNMEYPVNYCLSLERAYNNQIESNYLGHATSVGNSRSGITGAAGTGNLIQNNVFDDLSIGFQAQGGSWAGNVLFANFFTNISDKAILDHTTHTFYNLYEQNKFGTIVIDGYFGSQSHADVYRNESTNTVRANRNNSYHTFAGNVLGSPNVNFAYDEFASGGDYHIFHWGDPHIGNTNYVGTSPPMGHNFPGHTTTGGGFTYTNRGNTFTTTVTTNVLHTNMTSGSKSFTNYPAGSSTTFQLAFQDNVNTNKWWPDDGTILWATSAGTETNLTLNTSVTVSNGWTLWIVGSEAFNQKNNTNRITHYVSENLVYTNASGVNVTNNSTTDRSIPASLLHARVVGPPSWWKDENGNWLLWPAIGPDVPGYSTEIPAESMFHLMNSENTNITGTASSKIGRLRVGR